MSIIDNQLPVRRPRRPKQRRVVKSDRRRAVRASVIKTYPLPTSNTEQNSCDRCRQQKEKCKGSIPCHRYARFYCQCEFYSLSVRDNSIACDPKKSTFTV